VDAKAGGNQGLFPGPEPLEDVPPEASLPGKGRFLGAKKVLKDVRVEALRIPHVNRGQPLQQERPLHADIPASGLPEVDQGQHAAVAVRGLGSAPAKLDLAPPDETLVPRLGLAVIRLVFLRRIDPQVPDHAPVGKTDGIAVVDAGHPSGLEGLPSAAGPRPDPAATFPLSPGLVGSKGGAKDGANDHDGCR
jgi:hypothetical protein